MKFKSLLITAVLILKISILSSCKPVSNVSLSGDHAWNNILDSQVNFNLEEDRKVMIKPTQDGESYLGIRLCVNQTCLKESVSVTSPESAERESFGEAQGFFLNHFKQGNYTVRLQWRAWGKRQTVYSLGSYDTYRSITVNAQYDDILWIQSYQPDVLKPYTKDSKWVIVKDLFAELKVTENQRLYISYALSLFKKDFGKELESSLLFVQLLLNGHIIHDCTTLYETRSFLALTANIFKSCSVEVTEGSLYVQVRWRQSSSKVIWFSAPTGFDGYSGGRSLVIYAFAVPLNSIIEDNNLNHDHMLVDVFPKIKPIKTFTAFQSTLLKVSVAVIVSDINLILAANKSKEKQGFLSINLGFDGKVISDSRIISFAKQVTVKSISQDFFVLVQGGTHTLSLEAYLKCSSNIAYADEKMLSYSLEIMPGNTAPYFVFNDSLIATNYTLLPDELRHVRGFDSDVKNDEQALFTLSLESQFCGCLLSYDSKRRCQRFIEVHRTLENVNLFLKELQFNLLKDYLTCSVRITLNDNGSFGVGGKMKTTINLKIISAQSDLLSYKGYIKMNKMYRIFPQLTLWTLPYRPKSLARVLLSTNHGVFNLPEKASGIETTGNYSKQFRLTGSMQQLNIYLKYVECLVNRASYEILITVSLETLEFHKYWTFYVHQSEQKYIENIEQNKLVKPLLSVLLGGLKKLKVHHKGIFPSVASGPFELRINEMPLFFASKEISMQINRFYATCSYDSIVACNFTQQFCRLSINQTTHDLTIWLIVKHFAVVPVSRVTCHKVLDITSIFSRFKFNINNKLLGIKAKQLLPIETKCCFHSFSYFSITKCRRPFIIFLNLAYCPTPLSFGTYVVSLTFGFNVYYRSNILYRVLDIANQITDEINHPWLVVSADNIIKAKISTKFRDVLSTFSLSLICPTFIINGQYLVAKVGTLSFNNRICLLYHQRQIIHRITIQHIEEATKIVNKLNISCFDSVNATVTTNLTRNKALYIFPNTLVYTSYVLCSYYYENLKIYENIALQINQRFSCFFAEAFKQVPMCVTNILLSVRVTAEIAFPVYSINLSVSSDLCNKINRILPKATASNVNFSFNHMSKGIVHVLSDPYPRTSIYPPAVSTKSKKFVQTVLIKNEKIASVNFKRVRTKDLSISSSNNTLKIETPNVETWIKEECVSWSSIRSSFYWRKDQSFTVSLITIRNGPESLRVQKAKINCSNGEIQYILGRVYVNANHFSMDIEVYLKTIAAFCALELSYKECPRQILNLTFSRLPAVSITLLNTPLIGVVLVETDIAAKMSCKFSDIMLKVYLFQLTKTSYYCFLPVNREITSVEILYKGEILKRSFLEIIPKEEEYVLAISEFKFSLNDGFNKYLINTNVHKRIEWTLVCNVMQRFDLSCEHHNNSVSCVLPTGHLLRDCYVLGSIKHSFNGKYSILKQKILIIPDIVYDVQKVIIKEGFILYPMFFTNRYSFFDLVTRDISCLVGNKTKASPILDKQVYYCKFEIPVEYTSTLNLRITLRNVSILNAFYSSEQAVQLFDSGMSVNCSIFEVEKSVCFIPWNYKQGNYVFISRKQEVPCIFQASTAYCTPNAVLSVGEYILFLKTPESFRSIGNLYILNNIKVYNVSLLTTSVTFIASDVLKKYICSFDNKINVPVQKSKCLLPPLLVNRTKIFLSLVQETYNVVHWNGFLYRKQNYKIAALEPLTGFVSRKVELLFTLTGQFKIDLDKILCRWNNRLFPINTSWITEKSTTLVVIVDLEDYPVCSNVSVFSTITEIMFLTPTLSFCVINEPKLDKAKHILLEKTLFNFHSLKISTKIVFCVFYKIDNTKLPFFTAAINIRGRTSQCRLPRVQFSSILKMYLATKFYLSATYLEVLVLSLPSNSQKLFLINKDSVGFGVFFVPNMWNFHLMISQGKFEQFVNVFRHDSKILFSSKLPSHGYYNISLVYRNEKSDPFTLRRVLHKPIVYFININKYILQGDSSKLFLDVLNHQFFTRGSTPVYCDIAGVLTKATVLQGPRLSVLCTIPKRTLSSYLQISLFIGGFQSKTTLTTLFFRSEYVEIKYLEFRDDKCDVFSINLTDNVDYFPYLKYTQKTTIYFIFGNSLMQKFECSLKHLMIRCCKSCLSHKFSSITNIEFELSQTFGIILGNVSNVNRYKEQNRFNNFPSFNRNTVPAIGKTVLKLGLSIGNYFVHYIDQNETRFLNCQQKITYLLCSLSIEFSGSFLLGLQYRYQVLIPDGNVYPSSVNTLLYVTPDPLYLNDGEFYVRLSFEIELDSEVNYLCIFQNKTNYLYHFESTDVDIYSIICSVRNSAIQLGEYLIFAAVDKGMNRISNFLPISLIHKATISAKNISTSYRADRIFYFPITTSYMPKFLAYELHQDNKFVGNINIDVDSVDENYVALLQIPWNLLKSNYEAGFTILKLKFLESLDHGNEYMPMKEQSFINVYYDVKFVSYSYQLMKKLNQSTNFEFELVPDLSNKIFAAETEIYCVATDGTLVVASPILYFFQCALSGRSILAMKEIVIDEVKLTVLWRKVRRLHKTSVKSYEVKQDIIVRHVTDYLEFDVNAFFRTAATLKCVIKAGLKVLNITANKKTRNKYECLFPFIIESVTKISFALLVSIQGRKLPKIDFFDNIPVVDKPVVFNATMASPRLFIISGQDFNESIIQYCNVNGHQVTARIISETIVHCFYEGTEYPLSNCHDNSCRLDLLSRKALILELLYKTTHIFRTNNLEFSLPIVERIAPDLLPKDKGVLYIYGHNLQKIYYCLFYAPPLHINVSISPVSDVIATCTVPPRSEMKASRIFVKFCEVCQSTTLYFTYEMIRIGETIYDKEKKIYMFSGVNFKSETGYMPRCVISEKQKRYALVNDMNKTYASCSSAYFSDSISIYFGSQVRVDAPAINYDIVEPSTILALYTSASTSNFFVRSVLENESTHCLFDNKLVPTVFQINISNLKYCVLNFRKVGPQTLTLFNNHELLNKYNLQINSPPKVINYFPKIFFDDVSKHTIWIQLLYEQYHVLDMLETVFCNILGNFSKATCSQIDMYLTCSCSFSLSEVSNFSTQIVFRSSMLLQKEILLPLLRLRRKNRYNISVMTSMPVWASGSKTVRVKFNQVRAAENPKFRLMANLNHSLFYDIKPICFSKIICSLSCEQLFNKNKLQNYYNFSLFYMEKDSSLVLLSEKLVFLEAPKLLTLSSDVLAPAEGYKIGVFSLHLEFFYKVKVIISDNQYEDLSWSLTGEIVNSTYIQCRVKTVGNPFLNTSIAIVLTHKTNEERFTFGLRYLEAKIFLSEMSYPRILFPKQEFLFGIILPDFVDREEIRVSGDTFNCTLLNFNITCFMEENLEDKKFCILTLRLFYLEYLIYQKIHTFLIGEFEKKFSIFSVKPNGFFKYDLYPTLSFFGSFSGFAEVTLFELSGKTLKLLDFTCENRNIAVICNGNNHYYFSRNSSISFGIKGKSNENVTSTRILTLPVVDNLSLRELITNLVVKSRTNHIVFSVFSSINNRTYCSYGNTNFAVVSEGQQSYVCHIEGINKFVSSSLFLVMYGKRFRISNQVLWVETLEISGIFPTHIFNNEKISFFLYPLRKLPQESIVLCTLQGEFYPALISSNNKVQCNVNKSTIGMFEIKLCSSRFTCSHNFALLHVVSKPLNIKLTPTIVVLQHSAIFALNIDMKEAFDFYCKIGNLKAKLKKLAYETFECHFSYIFQAKDRFYLTSDSFNESFSFSIKSLRKPLVHAVELGNSNNLQTLYFTGRYFDKTLVPFCVHELSDSLERSRAIVLNTTLISCISASDTSGKPNEYLVVRGSLKFELLQSFKSKFSFRVPLYNHHIFEARKTGNKIVVLSKINLVAVCLLYDDSVEWKNYVATSMFFTWEKTSFCNLQSERTKNIRIGVWIPKVKKLFIVNKKHFGISDIVLRGKHYLFPGFNRITFLIHDDALLTYVGKLCKVSLRNTTCLISVANNVLSCDILINLLEVDELNVTLASFWPSFTFQIIKPLKLISTRIVLDSVLRYFWIELESVNVFLLKSETIITELGGLSLVSNVICGLESCSLKVFKSYDLLERNYSVRLFTEEKSHQIFLYDESSIEIVKKAKFSGVYPMIGFKHKVNVLRIRGSFFKASTLCSITCSGMVVNAQTILISDSLFLCQFSAEHQNFCVVEVKDIAKEYLEKSYIIPFVEFPIIIGLNSPLPLSIESSFFDVLMKNNNKFLNYSWSYQGIAYPCENNIFNSLQCSIPLLNGPTTITADIFVFKYPLQFSILLKFSLPATVLSQKTVTQGSFHFFLKKGLRLVLGSFICCEVGQTLMVRTYYTCLCRTHDISLQKIKVTDIEAVEDHLTGRIGFRRLETNVTNIESKILTMWTNSQYYVEKKVSEAFRLISIPVLVNGSSISFNFFDLKNTGKDGKCVLMEQSLVVAQALSETYKVRRSSCDLGLVYFKGYKARLLYFIRDMMPQSFDIQVYPEPQILSYKYVLLDIRYVMYLKISSVLQPKYCCSSKISSLLYYQDEIWAMCNVALNSGTAVQTVTLTYNKIDCSQKNEVANYAMLPNETSELVLRSPEIGTEKFQTLKMINFWRKKSLLEFYSERSCGKYIDDDHFIIENKSIFFDILNFTYFRNETSVLEEIDRNCCNFPRIVNQLANSPDRYLISCNNDTVPIIKPTKKIVKKEKPVMIFRTHIEYHKNSLLLVHIFGYYFKLVTHCGVYIYDQNIGGKIIHHNSRKLLCELENAFKGDGEIKILFLIDSVNRTTNHTLSLLNKRPSAFKMYPKYGSKYGGTRITFFSSFSLTDKITIEFGTQKLVLTIINETAAFVVTIGGNGNGMVATKIVNELGYVLYSTYFRFIDPIFSTTLFPAVYSSNQRGVVLSLENVLPKAYCFVDKNESKIFIIAKEEFFICPTQYRTSLSKILVFNEWESVGWTGDIFRNDGLLPRDVYPAYGILDESIKLSIKVDKNNYLGNQPSCMFDKTQVPAKWENETTITCYTPKIISLEKLCVSLVITTITALYPNEGLYFCFYPKLTFLHILPKVATLSSFRRITIETLPLQSKPPVFIYIKVLDHAIKTRLKWEVNNPSKTFIGTFVLQLGLKFQYLKFQEAKCAELHFSFDGKFFLLARLEICFVDKPVLRRLAATSDFLLHSACLSIQQNKLQTKFARVIDFAANFSRACSSQVHEKQIQTKDWITYYICFEKTNCFVLRKATVSHHRIQLEPPGKNFKGVYTGMKNNSFLLIDTITVIRKNSSKNVEIQDEEASSNISNKSYIKTLNIEATCVSQGIEISNVELVEFSPIYCYADKSNTKFEVVNYDFKVICLAPCNFNISSIRFCHNAVECMAVKPIWEKHQEVKYNSMLVQHDSKFYLGNFTDAFSQSCVFLMNFTEFLYCHVIQFKKKDQSLYLGAAITSFNLLGKNISTKLLDINKADISFGSVELYYQEQTQPHKCPIGSFCPGYKDIRKCFPGTFNPFKNLESCYSCPVGHICPGFGRSVPFICPAGWVCDEQGLYIPHKRCPEKFYCDVGTITTNATQAKLLRMKLLNFLAEVISPTLPKMLVAALHPLPCPPGSYCLEGVSEPNIRVRSVIHPQPCLQSFYCPAGTGRKMTLCPQGYYCPPKSLVPRPNPKGTYTDHDGAVAPRLCRPGLFAPLEASSTCSFCPAGHKCDSYGLSTPAMCEKGSYREAGTSGLSCIECPKGTFVDWNGASSKDDCLPCPPGLICDRTGLRKLPSESCPSGFKCGEMTLAATAKIAPCLPGTVCNSNKNSTGYLSCPEGYYCPSGVSDENLEDYTCNRPYYCPTGTIKESKYFSCPPDSKGKLASALLSDCSVTENCVEVFSTYFSANRTLLGLQYLPVLKSVNALQPNSKVLVIGNIGNIKTCLYLINSSYHFYVKSSKSLLGLHILCEILVGGKKIFLTGILQEKRQILCEYNPQTLISQETFYIKLISSFGLTNTELTARLGKDECCLNWATLITPSNFPNCSGLIIKTNEFDTKKYLYNKLSQQKYFGSKFGLWREMLSTQLVVRDINTTSTFFYVLPALHYFTFKIENIFDDEFINQQNMRVGIEVEDSSCLPRACSSCQRYCEELQSPCKRIIAIEPNAQGSYSLMPLEDVRIRVKANLYSSLAYSIVDAWESLVSIQTVSPARNNFTLGRETFRSLVFSNTTSQFYTKEIYLYATVFWKKTALSEIHSPLNLPPRYDALRRGRFLLNNDKNSNKRSYTNKESWWEQPDTDYAVTKSIVNQNREIFHGLQEEESSFEMNSVVLPYLPFISGCPAEQPYMLLWKILESPECAFPDIEYDDVYKQRYAFAYPERYDLGPLINYDHVRVLSSLSIFKYFSGHLTSLQPTSDICLRTFECAYSENASEPVNLPYWFNAPEETTLFSLYHLPISTKEFYEQSRFVKQAVSSYSLDAFIPLKVIKEEEDDNNECNSFCFPRKVRINIFYHQETIRIKKIIEANIEFSSFSTDLVDTKYDLEVSLLPLSYYDLVVKFAFGIELYLFFFVCLGAIVLLITGVFRFVCEVFAQNSALQQGSFYDLYRMISSPPLMGQIVLIIPLLLIFFGINLIINETSTNFLSSRLRDSYIRWESTEETDIVAEVKLYHRFGTAMVSLGVVINYHSCLIFVPQSISRTEDRLQELGDIFANKRNNWTPTVWRRWSIFFLSEVTGFFLVFIIEFSLWPEFPTYIWYFILFMGLFGGQIAEYLVHLTEVEALPGLPSLCSLGVVQSLVTLGSTDLVDFILGFMIEFGLMLIDRIYMDDLKSFLVLPQKAFASLYTYIQSLTSTNGSESGEEVDEEESYTSGSTRGVALEPVLEKYISYSDSITGLIFQVFLNLFAIIYRSEMVLPESYAIKEKDMIIYLWFNLIIIPFQLIVDTMCIRCNEAYDGVKFHEYLSYCKYRFEQRTLRWKGYETELDESLDEKLRTIDQLCFSSQYYFLLSLAVTGILMTSLGVVIINRHGQSISADPTSPIIFLFVAVLYFVVVKIFISLYEKFGLWKPPKADTGWNEEELEDEAINTRVNQPTRDELLAQMKLSNEKFRKKFVAYNKAWLLEKLPEILTEDVLQKNRPYLINQLGNIIRQVQPESDVESIPEIQFKTPNLSEQTTLILNMWLEKGKTVNLLKKLAKPFLLDKKLNRCQDCQIAEQLVCNFKLGFDKVMLDFFSKQDFDSEAKLVLKWREHIKNQELYTQCMSCRRRSLANDTKTIEKPKELLQLVSKSELLLLQWLKLSKDKKYDKAADRSVASPDSLPSREDVEYKMKEFSRATHSLLQEWVSVAKSRRTNISKRL